MHHSIKATNFEITPAISEYLDVKIIQLDKYVSKDDESIKCDIEIGKTTKHHRSGNIFRVEINVAIGKKVFRAVAEEETIYAAIDKAKDEITKHLRRNKDKKSTLFKRGGKKIKDILRFGRK